VAKGGSIMQRLGIVAAALTLAAGAVTADARADVAGRYQVTVTNITAGQTFTPLLFATHRPNLALFQAGEPVGNALEDLAEGGSVAALQAQLNANPRVGQTQATTSLLAPGASATVTIRARGDAPRLSIAAMLIPTNDTFMALDGFPLPERGTVETEAKAYDAGSEPNSELCVDIPGPFCGGEGTDLAENGEGFAHISRGISGVGEGASGRKVTEAQHDWRNPVAKITIRRLGG
jgi:hypothetical protein